MACHDADLLMGGVPPGEAGVTVVAKPRCFVLRPEILAVEGRLLFIGEEPFLRYGADTGRIIFFCGAVVPWKAGRA